ncbi:NAD(P)H-hydrate epimerase [Roseimaritima ulvae]|uniref:NAD(P)H-hydrate epimerase n=1 Tax=Roseimaritima ulvae TaxID=980254 RepID=A0A5B9QQT2_9BACT|nr:NAD(P)H-hydrate epimerase [Roseimaritima ulvae]QEG41378.1 Bifunctional NAD(P)H-hydrate repair enzyme Nnr [Roseimaritima ulvae]
MTTNTSLLRDQVRNVDRVAIEEYGMSGLVLMENAGRGAAEIIAPLLAGRRPLILCGKGNNAGDGYVIARHLQLLGCAPLIVQLVDPNELSGDAAANWAIAQHAEIPTRVAAGDALPEVLPEIEAAHAIVDAMLGTGASGPLREPYVAATTAANASTALRIAIDLPSGLDCDSGVPPGACFKAQRTLTFVASKRGFDNPDAKPWTGQVSVVPIGIPLRLLQSVMA